MTPDDRCEFSHLDPQGNARMVDVSAKAISTRTAVASARVSGRPEVISAILAGNLPKGDTLAVARVAAIQAAKRTAELIPLCHVLPLDAVAVDFAADGGDAIAITARATATARTGVEMEALTAAAIAALTIYDMAKSADKSLVIGPIRLEHKTGGKSGDYRRKD